MKKLNIVIIGLVVMIFNGCEKADNNIYTITGHYYHDCTKDPVKNAEIRLYQEPANGGATNVLLASTVTDSMGYYKFEFQEQNKEYLYLRIPAGRTIMQDIPNKNSYDNLDVYYSPSTNIQVSLKVVNPYTINDTLVINDLRGVGNLSIPGPFSSGILYNVANYPLLFMSYSGELKYLNWVILPNFPSNRIQQFFINKYCNDTIFVTVDIN